MKETLRYNNDNEQGNTKPQFNFQEADIAIAPLTVTLERESVIDFSKPFLSFDLKSNKNVANNTGTIFSFLQPLSLEIWVSENLPSL